MLDVIDGRIQCKRSGRLLDAPAPSSVQVVSLAGSARTQVVITWPDAAIRNK